MQIEMGMRPMEQSTVSPELHMPIYYGNIAERILPVSMAKISFLVKCYMLSVRVHNSPAVLISSAGCE